MGVSTAGFISGNYSSRVFEVMKCITDTIRNLEFEDSFTHKGGKGVINRVQMSDLLLDPGSGYLTVHFTILPKGVSMYKVDTKDHEVRQLSIHFGTHDYAYVGEQFKECLSLSFSAWGRNIEIMTALLQALGELLNQDAYLVPDDFYDDTVKVWEAS